MQFLEEHRDRLKANFRPASRICKSENYTIKGLFWIKSALRKLKSISDRQRKLLLLSSDIVILTFSTYLAFVLRFDQILPIEEIYQFWAGIIISIALKIILFSVFGLYRPLLRHSGLEMLEIIFKVTLVTDGLLILSSMILAPRLLPRSIQIIAAIVTLMLIINSRLTIRSIIWRTSNLRLSQKLTRRMRNWGQTPAKTTIIYGAGVTGYQIAEAIALEKNASIIGFVDDNPRLHGRELLHHKIFHSENLQTLIEDHHVQEVLLAIPSASAKQKASIIRELQQYPVTVKTVPSAQEIVSGRVSVTSLREIDIADLLGREEVPPNPKLLEANITSKTVLVTGAGGSIGSEICRQIAQLNPKKLILLEISEFALYSIDIELREEYQNLDLHPHLGSVTDRALLTRLFNEYEVDTIYHAAAYKHVPLVEHNPAQGVINNIYGTLVAAQTAKDCNVNTFVLISTDKAVRPTNVMGTTKRVAELVLQALADQPNPTTRFIMVRFGNVLGSSGSVVPRFRKQISESQPITLTNRDITRFFMTIPEAARLVIQAGAMGQGGDVFLLDMGEPVKIYDLAVQIIKLSGLQPGHDIDIKITGLRPGEKLYEELLISGDNVSQTEHIKIFSAREKMMPWEQLEPQLDALFISAQNTNICEMKHHLQVLVPEYQVPHQSINV